MLANKKVYIMENTIINLCKKFNIKGQFVSYKIFTSGHINTTCLVSFFDNGSINEYVIQKINKNVFKKPDLVMDNIVSVTEFIKNKVKSHRNADSKVLNFCQANDGKFFTIDENGDFWRMYNYVDKSVTFDSTSNSKILEETGKAFGEFQYFLSDYPIEKLNIIIPHFHNTVNRYLNLKNVANNNPVGRLRQVEDVVESYLNLEEVATKMYKMQKNNELQLRVTHNDTKCNNVLFDQNTNEHLCVIDLDTVMPGLIGFDFGDAIRFGASTAAEDETDLGKVKIDLNKFRAFTNGFLSEVATRLTPKEKETLALGAITMTLECGARFLTDYLDGDNYFKIEYEKHNLDRAKCQLALAEDMIKNYSKLNQIVDEIYNKIVLNENIKIKSNEKV